MAATALNGGDDEVQDQHQQHNDRSAAATAAAAKEAHKAPHDLPADPAALEWAAAATVPLASSSPLSSSSPPSSLAHAAAATAVPDDNNNNDHHHPPTDSSRSTKAADAAEPRPPIHVAEDPSSSPADAAGVANAIGSKAEPADGSPPEHQDAKESAAAAAPSSSTPAPSATPAALTTRGIPSTAPTVIPPSAPPAQSTTTSATTPTTPTIPSALSPKKPAAAGGRSSRRANQHAGRQQHILVSVTEDRATPTAETRATGSVFFGGAAATHVSLAVPAVSGFGTLRWALEHVVKDGDVVTVLTVRKQPATKDRTPAGLLAARQDDECETLLRLTPTVSQLVARSRRNLAAVIVAVAHDASETDALVRIAREEERAVTKIVMRDRPSAADGGGGGGGDDDGGGWVGYFWGSSGGGGGGGGGGAAAPGDGRAVSERLLGVCPVLLVSDSMIMLLGEHHTISDDDDELEDGATAFD
ncbi:hypothetical protein DFJ73DRAFT_797575 [Zopfochytrium polystomum]|nr:hypothetical protein DFJ73DRAFT_797575 [Zopfochytrium polystomum]